MYIIKNSLVPRPDSSDGIFTLQLCLKIKQKSGGQLLCHEKLVGKIKDFLRKTFFFEENAGKRIKKARLAAKGQPCG